MRIALLGVLLALVTNASADTRSASGKPHPTTAVVFVLDRSGSMQGPKLDTAKAAIRAAIVELASADEVAVVTFDSEAAVAVPLGSAAASEKRDELIAKILSGGGTNIAPALVYAHELLAPSKAKRKHVILLSDGEAPTDGLAKAVKDLRGDKATLSAIGVQGADMNLLADLAKQGQGRVYQIDDVKKLTAIMVKETQALLGP
jgi:Mg-chelatase subunit ChlD